MEGYIACVDRKVFKLFLKESTFWGALSRSGRTFQSLGVAEQNARSTMLCSLVLETFKEVGRARAEGEGGGLAHKQFLEVGWGMSVHTVLSEEGDLVDNPVYFIGSQCSVFKLGLIWSNLCTLIRI